MIERIKKLPVWFFTTQKGRTPVIEWILELGPEDKKRIGRELQSIEFGWPIGMPLCRAIKGYTGLWEGSCQLIRRKDCKTFFLCSQGENGCFA